MHWRVAYLHYRLTRVRAGKSGLLELCLFFEGRLFELAAAVILVAMSVYLQIWEQSVNSGSLRELVRHIDPHFISLFFGALGSLRLIAICANGMWPVWGPWIRSGGAFSGALIFGNMAGSLFTSSAHFPPIEITIYCVLVFFELISMYRALVMISVYRWKRSHH